MVGVLPVAQYRRALPGEAAVGSWGCSVQGLGVANYAGLVSTYLVGDWCSGWVWGVAWDPGAGRWQMQELMQTTLQFTAGTVDTDGSVLALDCRCNYNDQSAPATRPATGALWRFVPADQVPHGAPVAALRDRGRGEGAGAYAGAGPADGGAAHPARPSFVHVVTGQALDPAARPDENPTPASRGFGRRARTPIAATRRRLPKGAPSISRIVPPATSRTPRAGWVRP